jgi:hypothetical protein
VYHPKCYPDIESDSSSSIDLFRSLVEKLSAKINFALDDAIGESPRGLTWKQRNGAKKQSWGSCATLGMMLSFSDILPHLDYTLLQLALSSLFRCIQLSSFINEKISAAAINALLVLPVALWEYISCKCDCIGRGLATSFGFLDEVSSFDPVFGCFLLRDFTNRLNPPKRKIRRLQIIITSKVWRIRFSYGQRRRTFVDCSSFGIACHFPSSSSTGGSWPATWRLAS